MSSKFLWSLISGHHSEVTFQKSYKFDDKALSRGLQVWYQHVNALQFCVWEVTPSGNPNLIFLSFVWKFSPCIWVDWDSNCHRNCAFHICIWSCFAFLILMEWITLVFIDDLWISQGREKSSNCVDGMVVGASGEDYTFNEESAELEQFRQISDNDIPNSHKCVLKWQKFQVHAFGMDSMACLDHELRLDLGDGDVLIQILRAYMYLSTFVVWLFFSPIMIKFSLDMFRFSRFQILVTIRFSCTCISMWRTGRHYLNILDKLHSTW